MATPFVQGRLRKEGLTVRIDSQCGLCRARLALDVSDGMQWQVRAGEDTILAFEPSIQWAAFKGKTIVRDY